MWKVIGTIILIGIGLFLLIQLVPYGRNHTNPPVVQEPTWDSPQTRQLAVRACFDCHSNETVWPWYSNIAPVSWLLANDVAEGRRTLNFSEWGRQQRGLEDLVEVVQEGGMPPFYYIPLHPQAQLSSPERQALAQGLAATAGVQGEGRQNESD